MVTIEGNQIVEKGGYLTKLGHKVKNWKRRWFVLREGKISYYKKPKDAKPCGEVKLNDITYVKETQGYHSKNHSIDRPNCFIIHTNAHYILCSADNERDREEWIDVIEFARKLSQAKLLADINLPIHGKLHVTIIEAVDLPKLNVTKPSVDCYATISVGDRKFTTMTVFESTKPQFSLDVYRFDIVDYNNSLIIHLMDMNKFLANELIGTVVINLKNLKDGIPRKVLQWYPLSKRGKVLSAKVRVCIEYCPLIRGDDSIAQSVSIQKGSTKKTPENLPSDGLEAFVDSDVKAKCDSSETSSSPIPSPSQANTSPRNVQWQGTKILSPGTSLPKDNENRRNFLIGSSRQSLGISLVSNHLSSGNVFTVRKNRNETGSNFTKDQKHRSAILKRGNYDIEVKEEKPRTFTLGDPKISIDTLLISLGEDPNVEDS
eukprot:TRINITY_DN8607_c0_g1_i1.p1 TRINITY_DN8607_c0_g1~~TRINITY_DN8607_c0_g1_i1.p1  ORF type:complete len:468 (-),score=65.95 TRINITY_DN8607_c0_g1_i1:102-1394(-)